MGIFFKSREDEINSALMKQPVDFETLRKISRQKGGFINNRVRSRVWPKLLNVNRYTISDFRSFIDPHRDDSQVRCDVERSLWNFTHIITWKESFRDKRRQALSDIIMAILCRNKTLYYYQGFHDIVSIFLLVLEEDHLAFALSESVSQQYLSDYMTEDFDVVSKSMRLLLVLIQAVDKELYDFLKKSRIEPFFATSWLITWFAHDIRNLDEIARIYDAFLCSHPLFSFYVCAAYVVHLREELLNGECDFAAIHNMLVHAPNKHGFPFQSLLQRADELMLLIPVNRLKTLCDDELLDLIVSNKIALIAKPYGKNHRRVDSDWKLLQRVKAAKSQQRAENGHYPVVRYLVNNTLTSWGWTVSASASPPLRSSQHTALTDSNEGGGRGLLGVQGLFWSLAVVVTGILSYALLMNPTTATAVAQQI